MSGIFWSALFLVFYAYFGYPLSLAFVSAVRKRGVRKGPIEPHVTLIVTAHNEEKRLPGKIENCLALRYPREKIQILVASDGSTDRTNAIVSEHTRDGVELLAILERRGKENAQREAVKIAKGEILVFTDVATELDPEGLEEIVSNFADPTVGCVSSEDHLIWKDGGPSGEGFYVRYEMWLRSLESRVYSLVGLSGSFFAARKEVCGDFSPEMQSDFRTLLNSVKMGLRGISDPNAIGYYRDVSDERREFERKVRTVIRGLTVFFHHMEFLNPFRYAFFSYQYFCHKFLRWCVPFFLFAALFANIVLSFEYNFYFVLLLVHVSFYSIGLYGLKRGRRVPRLFMKIPMYFLTVNTSIAMAWWKYLKGERVTMWAPTKR